MIFGRLRRRLAAKLSLLVFLLTLVFLSPNYKLVRNNLNQIEMTMIERGKSVARGLSRGSEYGILIENEEVLNRVVTKYINEEDLLYIAIRNASGKVLASYGRIIGDMPDAAPTDDSPANQAFRKNLSKCRVTETKLLYDIISDVVTIREERNREDIGLLQPDTLSGSRSLITEKIGTVQIGLSKANMTALMRRSVLAFIFLTIVAVIIAILTTITIAGTIVKSIKQLATAAEKVSSGDLNYTVTVKSKDEIGNLAESFNKMVDHLRSSHEENEQYSRELEEKAQELSKSNEELNAFVYTVSHDLKAPVVSLQGFSSILVNDYGSCLDENGKMYVERIQKNSEHMGVLIESLLELSRAGRAKNQEELVEISDVISNVINELSVQLEERDTKLVVMNDMPTIWCDRVRIGQVFSNLIGNANKFMGDDNKNPTIELGHNVQDGYHKFYVKDNGIGINEEYHEKIFHIFQRLEDIETEGTGVGLAIVKKIVESSGGRTWVDSVEGSGTTIYFTLPQAADVRVADQASGKILSKNEMDE